MSEKEFLITWGEVCGANLYYNSKKVESLDKIETFIEDYQKRMFKMNNIRIYEIDIRELKDFEEKVNKKYA